MSRYAFHSLVKSTIAADPAVIASAAPVLSLDLTQSALQTSEEAVRDGGAGHVILVSPVERTAPADASSGKILSRILTLNVILHSNPDMTGLEEHDDLADAIVDALHGAGRTMGDLRGIIFSSETTGDRESGLLKTAITIQKRAVS